MNAFSGASPSLDEVTRQISDLKLGLAHPESAPVSADEVAENLDRIAGAELLDTEGVRAAYRELELARLGPPPPLTWEELGAVRAATTRFSAAVHGIQGRIVLAADHLIQGLGDRKSGLHLAGGGAPTSIVKRELPGLAQESVKAMVGDAVNFPRLQALCEPLKDIDPDQIVANQAHPFSIIFNTTRLRMALAALSANPRASELYGALSGSVGDLEARLDLRRRLQLAAKEIDHPGLTVSAPDLLLPQDKTKYSESRRLVEEREQKLKLVQAILEGRDEREGAFAAIGRVFRRFTQARSLWAQPVVARWTAIGELTDGIRNDLKASLDAVASRELMVESGSVALISPDEICRRHVASKLSGLHSPGESGRAAPPQPLSEILNQFAGVQEQIGFFRFLADLDAGRQAVPESAPREEKGKSPLRAIQGLSPTKKLEKQLLDTLGTVVGLENGQGLETLRQVLMNRPESGAWRWLGLRHPGVPEFAREAIARRLGEVRATLRQLPNALVRSMVRTAEENFVREVHPVASAVIDHFHSEARRKTDLSLNHRPAPMMWQKAAELVGPLAIEGLASEFLRSLTSSEEIGEGRQRFYLIVRVPDGYNSRIENGNFEANTTALSGTLPEYAVGCKLGKQTLFSFVVNDAETQHAQWPEFIKSLEVHIGRTLPARLGLAAETPFEVAILSAEAPEMDEFHGRQRAA